MLTKMRMNPSMNLIVESCITLSRQIAAVEVRRKMERIGMSLFQVMNRLYFIAATRDVVKANNPDSAVASPYEGIRKGSRVIMKCRTRTLWSSAQNWPPQPGGISVEYFL